MTTIWLEVDVEAKDEYAGGEGLLPSPDRVAAVAQDALVDATRGEWTLGWMVREVRPGGEA